MTRDERRAMWHARIESFKTSGESSVTAWCVTNNICVQSMYTWLKKDWHKTDTARTAPQYVNYCLYSILSSLRYTKNK